jgi:hypothetical protein
MPMKDYRLTREARAGCTVVIPYREEMTKRHLKLTGDLGRVVFMVGKIMGMICDQHLAGVRPSEQGVHRRERAAFGHSLQPHRARLPYKVRRAKRVERG